MTSTAPTQAPDAGTHDLRLLSILESGLPAELGSADEPATYTVPAVFSRQVGRDERTRIEDPETARRLSRPGGETSAGRGLRLVVSDRRLLIENTNLAQLRDGLAADLAAMLRELGSDLRAVRDEAAAATQARSVEVQRRADLTHAAVADIRFE